MLVQARTNLCKAWDKVTQMRIAVMKNKVNPYKMLLEQTSRKRKDNQLGKRASRLLTKELVAYNHLRSNLSCIPESNR